MKLSLSIAPALLTLLPGLFLNTAPALACSYQVTPTTINAPGSAIAESIYVNTMPGCGWSLANAAPWITITASPEGQGGGYVRFIAAPNTGLAARAAILTVAGVRVMVNQAAATCAFAVRTPPPGALGPAGGTGTIMVSASTAGCVWNASSNVPWFGFSRPNGSTALWTAQPNNGGVPRSGTVIIAGQAFTIMQK